MHHKGEVILAQLQTLVTLHIKPSEFPCAAVYAFPYTFSPVWTLPTTQAARSSPGLADVQTV